MLPPANQDTVFIGHLSGHFLVPKIIKGSTGEEREREKTRCPARN